MVGAASVSLAAARRVRPGLGTIAQVVLVGVVISVAARRAGALPDALAGTGGGRSCWRSRSLAIGIAAYLGEQHRRAGRAEAAALAWDPPSYRSAWSYSLVQGGGALGGWLLGATIGVGTIAVVVALGPARSTSPAGTLHLDVARRRPTRDGPSRRAHQMRR